MEKAKTYRDLKVWQLAHEFVMEVYRICKFFPDDEKFGLTSQLKRSSVSVPSNIAEGFSRWGNQDKIKFYNIAEASLAEADYQLFLAGELKYGDPSQALSLANQLKPSLARLINSIRA
jgi:four helix bundle protein